MGKSRAPKSATAAPDEAELEQAAIRYLERYSSSVAGLRRVLRRRIRRAAGAGSDDVAAGDAAVEAVLRRLVQARLLDDARYAEFRAASLARRGASLYAIRRDLGVRGVGAALADAALAVLKAETGGGADEVDRAAALTLARRRRIGPFRAPTVRAAFRTRDLAALGRAGFSFEIARAVIDGEPESG